MTVAVDPEAAPAAPIGPAQAWSIRRGVTSAGTGLVLWGAWLVREQPVRTLPVRNDVRIWSLVLVGALALAATLRVLIVRRMARRAAEEAPVAGTIEQQVGLWVMYVVCVLSLCAWLRYAGVRGVVVGLDDGFASASRMAVAGGAIFAAAGLVLSARRPSATRVPLAAGGHRLRPLVAAGVAAGLVIGVTVGEAARANGFGVHAKTTSAAAVPAVPTRVTRQAWSLPVGSGVTGAVAAGPGVVISTAANQLESVDGRTGKVRWSYARDHTTVTNLQASPDGELVAATLMPANVVAHSSDYTVVVVFNAGTGSISHQFDLGSDGSGGKSFSTRLADDALVVSTSRLIDAPSDDEISTVVAYSPTTGRRQWRVDLPPSPDAASLGSASAGPQAGVTLVSGRGGLLSVVELLDLSNGRVRWRHAADALAELRESPDNSLLLVTMDQSETLLDGATGRSVDLPTGATVLALLDHGRAALNLHGSLDILDVSRRALTPTGDICETHVDHVDPGAGASGLPGDEVAAGAVCALPPATAGPPRLQGQGVLPGGLPLHLPAPKPFSPDQPVVLAAPGAVVAYTYNGGDSSDPSARLLGFS